MIRMDLRIPLLLVAAGLAACSKDQPAGPTGPAPTETVKGTAESPTQPLPAHKRGDPKPNPEAATDQTAEKPADAASPVPLPNDPSRLGRPEVTVKIGELARLIGGIKDKASALAAKPRLEAMVGEFAELKGGGALDVPNNIFVVLEQLARNGEVGPVLANSIDALITTLR
ncbi:MAG: hypothetical protein RL398_2255 [Planctomycetota bacterium]|jgi:hypothetical protein